MTEKQLNENIIRNKIKGVCQDCIYLDKIVPILNKMLNETYIDGLEQGKLDKEMGKQQLIKFLKDKIKEEYIGGQDILSQSSFKAKKQVFQEVLNFLRGDKDE